jgi:hypothetical protein
VSWSFIFILLLTAQAFSQIHRLPPRAFPELPPAIALELAHRGCSIPQPEGVEGRQNVISGQFAKPGQTDWAVLCSRKGASSILVFWNGAAANPDLIEPRPDNIYMQSNAAGKMVFSRQIDPVGEAYILEHYRAYGGTKPPPIDHQGINDVFVGKASEVLYFYNDKWLHLTGAD